MRDIVIVIAFCPAWAETPSLRRAKKVNSDMCLFGHIFPTVFLLGVQKAGTTTLAGDMSKAGLRSVIPGRKETHIWTKPCNWVVETDLTPEHFWSGSITDCSFNSTVITQIAEKLPSCTQFQHEAFADYTPLNLRLNGLPHELFRLYGKRRWELKFMIALRDPARRFQSGFYHAKKCGAMPVETFGNYVAMLCFALPGLAAQSKSFAQAYPYDQVFRSLYGAMLNRWLDYFSPNQFALIPTHAYFSSNDARVSALRELSDKFHLGLNLSYHIAQGSRVSWANKNSHPDLEVEDGYKVCWKQLYRSYFAADLTLLADTIASTIGQGLTLTGYTGDANSRDIKQFLSSNW